MTANLPVLLAWTSATFALLQAVAVLLQRKVTFPRIAFAVGMMALACEAFFAGLTLRNSAPSEMLRWQVPRLFCASCMVLPWIAFSVTYARGSAGKSPGWKYAMVVAGLLPAVLVLVFRADVVIAILPSAFAFQPVLSLGWPAFVINGAMLATSIFVLMNLERTYRAAVGSVRWRIKFMLLGVGLLFVVRLFTSSHSLLFQTVDSRIELMKAGALMTGCLLILRSLFRSGHFEMDVFPSPAVLRGSVTLVLAGVYLVVVGTLWRLTEGQTPAVFALKALLVLLALAALAVALQSDRTQLLVRRFVSRNFQRPFYDYRGAWKSFTEGTVNRLDQRELCEALIKLVADLFQAKSVSIWLEREDGGLYCAGSTVKTESGAAGKVPGPQEAADLKARFIAHPEPTQVEHSKESWAITLREMHPRLFKKGGNRAAAPLLAHGTVVGVLLLGDRISGGDFGEQDLDMLRCVADHSASNLLNLQLTARSLQHRELAAFQTMATFFVHDLKNAASTLNLMLPNLRVHWDNPEFREDALRGIGKTVSHINSLVGRLGQLRKGLALQPELIDLNALVRRALAGWKNVPDVKLTSDLQPVEPVNVDANQLETVIANLLLNAQEATSGGAGGPGCVHVRTGREGAWATIEVSDTGCGMSGDFMAQSLFRPFQTTKKQGLGIGMFQSKMIIDAHGGRLTVESSVGKGTRFQILLPLGPAARPDPATPASPPPIP